MDTTSYHERECRNFAANFPNAANVQRAIAYAERGQVSWANLYTLFSETLTNAVAELKAENEGN